MYPAELLDLFPPFPRTDMVFVAMSFDHEFDELWDEVLQPAARDVAWEGRQLYAHRVDLSRKSDSIVGEIVKCIAESRLVLADISTVGKYGKRRRPIRSANVMYEVGIAHAVRLPDEVVLVRGDGDPLDFDVAGVRVHHYPSNHSSARKLIGTLLSDALQSVDQRRSLVLRRAVGSLTPPMFLVLHSIGDIAHPRQTDEDPLSFDERRDAIAQLLTGGMIEAVCRPLPGNFMEQPVARLFSYRTTAFGLAVYQQAREQLGFNAAMCKWLRTEAGQAWIKQATARAANKCP